MFALLLRGLRLSSTVFELSHEFLHGCSLFILLQLCLARGRDALAETKIAKILLKLPAEPVTALLYRGKAQLMGHVVMVQA